MPYDKWTDLLSRQLACLSGIKLKRTYNLSAPRGVNGRNSDNTLIQSRLGWEPSTPLQDGLLKTYDWIESQVEALLCI
jgi:nucleoside-diphosphate-sugar epimerase